MLCLAAMSPLAANAASVTFNFNSHTPGPYLQPSDTLTPEIGTGQTATVGILNANNPNQAFQFVDSNISGFKPAANGVNTGTNISDAEGSGDVFQLVFSHAIHTLNLNFTVIPGADFPPNTNVNPLQVSAFLNQNSATPLATALGFGNAYNSTNVDQYFGNLTLTSVVGFTTVDLSLFNPNATPSDTFAFDDITADDSALSNVPEPGAIALALALGLPAAWRLRKARKSGSKQRG